MISAYSIAMSAILFNISLVAVYMLRRKQDFIARYGIQTLIIITILGLIRLLSPVDWELAHIVRSYTILPAVQSVLAFQLAADWLTMGRALLAIWLIGTLIFIVRDVAVIVRFKLKRSRYDICENEQILKVAKELDIDQLIVVTSCVEMPHVAGHFRQRIYVPPIELSDEDWKYVLLHEKQHITAHDQHIKLLFVLLRALFWWNPISHLFMMELDAILELRCDNAVTARLDEEANFAYFGAMLNVIRQMATADRKLLSTSSALIGDMSNPKYNIKQRFEVYRNSNKRRGKGVRCAIQILIILVFVASYFVIVQPAYFPSEEELSGTSGMIENEAFIIFNGEEYSLYVENEKVLEIGPEELTDYPYNTFPIYNGG